MKRLIKLVIIIMALLFISKWSYGQGLKVSAITEKTVMGLQSGAELSYRFRNYIGIGFFYQKDPKTISETESGSNEFSGMNLSFPIARCEKLILSGVLRGGLSNRRFAVVTPSIETEMLISKHLSLGVGLGIRATEAAINGKLIWNL